MKITFEGTIEELMEFFGGTEEEQKETEEKNVPDDISAYARFFDCDCAGWTKNSEKNMWFLKHNQDYANERLRCEGHLFLNDVYDMLGLPRTAAGMTVGWIYKNEISHVDFGIYKFKKNKEFINGYTPDVLLDFNVDGWIIDRI